MLEKSSKGFQFLWHTSMENYAMEHGLWDNPRIQDHILNNKLNGRVGDDCFLPQGRARYLTEHFTYSDCWYAPNTLAQHLREDYLELKPMPYTRESDGSLREFYTLPFEAVKNESIQERAKLFGKVFTEPFELFFKAFDELQKLGLI